MSCAAIPHIKAYAKKLGQLCNYVFLPGSYTTKSMQLAFFELGTFIVCKKIKLTLLFLCYLESMNDYLMVFLASSRTIDILLFTIQFY